MSRTSWPFTGLFLLMALGVFRIETASGCEKDIRVIFQAEPIGSSLEPFAGATGEVEIPVPEGTPVPRHTAAAAIVSQLESCPVGLGLCQHTYTNCRGAEVPCDGIQGWSLSIGLDGDLTLVDASVDAANPEILCGGVFTTVNIVDPERPGPTGEPQGQGVTSGVAFFCGSRVSLPPRGTETVLGITVEAARPAEGQSVSGTLRCRDGLFGPGPDPIESAAVIEGGTFPFCECGELTVRFTAGRTAFRRGDVNADGELNITDPIRLLGSLFLGSEPPPCLDAADADDTGFLRITDVIALLGYLFSGSGPPPAPGPADCGVDPTPDALGCPSFPPCR